MAVTYEVRFADGYKLWDMSTQSYDIDAHEWMRSLGKCKGVKLDLDRLRDGKRVMHLRANSLEANIILILTLPSDISWQLPQQ